MKCRTLATPLVLLVGCASGRDALQETTTLSSASMLVTGAECTKPCGDAPAQEAYLAMERSFAEGTEESLRFGVYRLVDPPLDAARHLADRARGFGIVADPADTRRSDKEYVVADRGLRLSVNPSSGTERFVRTDRFHRSVGVSPDKLMPDDFFLQLGRRHINANLAFDTAGTRLYPYKVRRYFNESHSATGLLRRDVYQVAVAYNMLIDGLPVVGPGGKVAVHLDPDGLIVSHESSVRRPLNRLLVVSGADMRSPAAGLREAMSRRANQGVPAAEYKVSRAEFGYLRLARGSAQSVLVPHYAFMFEPTTERGFGKPLAEFVNAVPTREVEDLLAADAQLEERRIASEAQLARALAASDGGGR